MSKAVASKKFVLLALESYQDLLRKQQQQEDSSPIKSLNQRLLEGGERTTTDSEVVASLNLTKRFDNSAAEHNKLAEEVVEPPKEVVEEKANFLSERGQETIVEHLILSGCSGGKVERSKIILKTFNRTKLFRLNKETGHIEIPEKSVQSSSDLLTFLIHLQSPNKKLSTEDLAILRELKVGQHLIANTYGKHAVTNLDEESQQAAEKSPRQWFSMFS